MTSAWAPAEKEEEGSKITGSSAQGCKATSSRNLRSAHEGEAGGGTARGAEKMCATSISTASGCR
eukprot:CAMPEP_0196584600 /NCGR_PEP_ID=MMETSP1081-20130531/47712_1 /TAXON_ID=36882 /ORGANISM="Pyramimonas amylifera, Strain CCMP720" /LENGTH=64 /DNA_ID=CAMNT_0041905861 /DNA_START=845 /DNA_END=1039 /DNA_ORIENTATION=-